MWDDEGDELLEIRMELQKTVRMLKATDNDSQIEQDLAALVEADQRLDKLFWSQE